LSNLGHEIGANTITRILIEPRKRLGGMLNFYYRAAA